MCRVVISFTLTKLATALDGVGAGATAVLPTDIEEKDEDDDDEDDEEEEEEDDDEEELVGFEGVVAR